MKILDRVIITSAAARMTPFASRHCPAVNERTLLGIVLRLLTDWSVLPVLTLTSHSRLSAVGQARDVHECGDHESSQSDAWGIQAPPRPPYCAHCCHLNLVIDSARHRVS